MRLSKGALSLVALARLVHGQTLPYNPTQLSLLTNFTTVYMFRPAPQSHNQAQLLALDVSGTLSASSLPWDTLSSSLPFLNSNAGQPYTATVETDGSVIATTGNCSDGADGLDVWNYTPKWSRDGGANTWSQAGVTANGPNTLLAAPQYLSSSIAFSETVNGSSQAAYIFGGMCPISAQSTEAWQSAAEYSNAMAILSPSSSDSTGAEQYQVTLLENRGPPIPQAGVSITPLFPTYSLSTSGSPQTQQQNFVLLGGHTQTAFINMSQVAVFSLPQQSWSFMPVEQPTNAKTDLARRQSALNVTPRSGHTAVLSESGDSIVIFGGWVGNVNTPATPQLAVLKLGDGYGGNGDWKWTVPVDKGQGLSSGSGIYGHGAVMLPGGVMMVAGGYEIPSSSARRFKRTAQIGSTRTLFYNVTEGSWLQSYTVPSDFVKQEPQSPGLLSSKSQKVGLGTGLGVGAALLVSVVVLYVWYTKRVRRSREDRESALLIHSSDGSSAGPVEQRFLDNGEFDGRGGDDLTLESFWPVQDQAENPYPRPAPMQHTTGMFVNVPSPTRGLRRGISGKSYQYQAAPRYDDKRMSRGSGNIHPIAEQENEDGISIKSDREQLDDAEAKLKEIERVLTIDDPFSDPTPNPLGSHPVSPANAGDSLWRIPTAASRMGMPARKPIPIPIPEKTSNWTVEPGVDEDEHSYYSRSDDRTSSTLSERSQHSALSNGSITRTLSTRTGAILSAALAAQRRSMTQEISPTRERAPVASNEASYFQTRARSSTGGSGTPGAANPAEREFFTTTKSSFLHLQSEGEALLAGRPIRDRDDPYQRAVAAHPSTQSNHQAPGFSRGPPPIAARKREGWMGSIRRALNVVSMGERSFSMTSGMAPYSDDPRSSSSSPTKDRGERLGNTPRRAVSDGGALLRQKRGQQDWDEKDWTPYRDDPENWGEPKVSTDKRQAEEDWDVEGAANQRDFQVMFTVPKSRLRVVNDDMDRASLRSASDGALSRNGSMKELRREQSLKMLRQRIDDERRRLSSTEEELDEAEKEKAA